MEVASTRIIAASADFTTQKAILPAGRSTRSPLRIEICIDLPGEFVDELFSFFVRQGREIRLNLVSQLLEPSERRDSVLSFQNGPKRVSLTRFLNLNLLLFG
jgi:hypothetical protein